MNWLRLLVRFMLSFIVLFFLGYVVPGFSGLTIPLLIFIGIVITLVSALVERIVSFSSKRQRTLILFLTSAVVIYFFSFALIGRPPVASAIFASILISWVELLFPEHSPKEKKMLP